MIAHNRFLLFLCALAVLMPTSACELGSVSDDHIYTQGVADKLARYRVIRAAAAARGIGNAYLLAGIANTETGLAHCWSEATWACQGPSSPDCGGGPVIAGSSDGPCSAAQGGLGLFQFDAGTHADTLNAYGRDVLTVDGQIGHAIGYVVNMVKISAYTTNAETDEKARAWISNFDIDDPGLRDQWIKTVLRYYNGCQPTWSCWQPRYGTYSDGLWAAVDEPGGRAFWGQEDNTRCGDSPPVVGAINAKYLALGGCESLLGAPVAEERGAPDGGGRYSVFEHGSIYWTQSHGAFEVHGQIRDKWAEVGWEAGILGYPTTDETTTPDSVGRYNVFERGSIYWSPNTGAHEVHGVIRDAWASSGWERGPLGYPTSDEYDVDGGRRSDFQKGSISWNSTTGEVAVELDGDEPQAWKVLNIDYQVQSTGYWCGPAATRMALSARMNPPSQATLAAELGTTTNGTDWIGQITAVLNSRLGATPYKTTEMPNDPPTTSQRNQLWADIVRSIDDNYPLVTNIVAPPTNHPPGYPNTTIYHYFTVIGYNPLTSQVYIADSANFGGNQQYWLSFDQLATLIPPKGYSSYD